MFLKKPCDFCSKVVEVPKSYEAKWVCRCGCYEYPVNPVTCTDCALKLQNLEGMRNVKN